MPYQYYFDEPHIREWMTLSKTDEGAQDYMRKYVHDVQDFNGYLDRVGGLRKMQELRNIERLLEPQP